MSLKWTQRALVQAIVQDTELPYGVAPLVLKHALSRIKSTVVAGSNAMLAGFSIFGGTYQASSNTCSSRTGETAHARAVAAIQFSGSKSFRHVLNISSVGW